MLRLGKISKFRKIKNILFVGLSLSLLVFICCFPVFQPKGGFQPYPGEFQIQIGPYDVSVYPSQMPELLNQMFPNALNHPIVQNFVQEYQPIWAFTDLYFNDTVNAPEQVNAGLLVSLNQSGFWQLVFSSNESQVTTIRWTCEVSGDRMQPNSTSILQVGIAYLRSQLPAEPIRLARFYLAANYPIKEYLWHAFFVIQTGPYVNLETVIAENGTLIDQHWFIPPDGATLSRMVLILIATTGTIVLVVVIFLYFRFRSRQKERAVR